VTAVAGPCNPWNARCARSLFWLNENAHSAESRAAERCSRTAVLGGELDQTATQGGVAAPALLLLGGVVSAGRRLPGPRDPAGAAPGGVSGRICAQVCVCVCARVRVCTCASDSSGRPVCARAPASAGGLRAHKSPQPRHRSGRAARDRERQARPGAERTHVGHVCARSSKRHRCSGKRCSLRVQHADARVRAVDTAGRSEDRWRPGPPPALPRRVPPLQTIGCRWDFASSETGNAAGGGRAQEAGRAHQRACLLPPATGNPGIPHGGEASSHVGRNTRRACAQAGGCACVPVSVHWQRGNWAKLFPPHLSRACAACAFSCPCTLNISPGPGYPLSARERPRRRRCAERARALY